MAVLLFGLTTRNYGGYFSQECFINRSHENIYLGASPRGSLALMRSIQAYALLEGRDFVQPDDVKILAYPTLGHRIIIDPSAHIRGVDNAQIIDEIIGRVRVPGDRARGSN